MSPIPSFPLRRLLLALASAGLMVATASNLLAQNGANSVEIKRITDRYALTRSRISALLDLRQNPVPLPANPPNPFYQPAPGPEAQPTPGPEADPNVPPAADESDIDTLRRLVGTLKIGGVITRNGVPHVTINNAACKVGDVVTVGPKDRPIYLKLVALGSGDLTLGLNDATLVVPLRK